MLLILLKQPVSFEIVIPSEIFHNYFLHNKVMFVHTPWNAIDQCLNAPLSILKAYIIVIK